MSHLPSKNREELADALVLKDLALSISTLFEVLEYLFITNISAKTCTIIHSCEVLSGSLVFANEQFRQEV
jgi:hypothetical protein